MQGINFILQFFVLQEDIPELGVDLPRDINHALQIVHVLSFQGHQVFAIRQFLALVIVIRGVNALFIPGNLVDPIDEVLHLDCNLLEGPRVVRVHGLGVLAHRFLVQAEGVVQVGAAIILLALRARKRVFLHEGDGVHARQVVN